MGWGGGGLGLTLFEIQVLSKFLLVPKNGLENPTGELALL